jgi:DNA repair ATPase RecN
MNRLILSMTREEIDAFFDDLGRDLDIDILEEARKKAHHLGRSVVLAVAVLKMPDGEVKIAYEQNEYGDGEGISQIKDYIRRNQGGLEPGERLYFKLVGLNLTSEQLEE